MTNTLTFQRKMQLGVSFPFFFFIYLLIYLFFNENALWKPKEHLPSPRQSSLTLHAVSERVTQPWRVPQQNPNSRQQQMGKFRVKKKPPGLVLALSQGKLPSASEFPQLFEYWESTEPSERPRCAEPGEMPPCTSPHVDKSVTNTAEELMRPAGEIFHTSPPLTPTGDENSRKVSQKQTQNDQTPLPSAKS